MTLRRTGFHRGVLCRRDVGGREGLLAKHYARERSHTRKERGDLRGKIVPEASRVHASPTLLASVATTRHAHSPAAKSLCSYARKERGGTACPGSIAILF